MRLGYLRTFINANHREAHMNLTQIGAAIAARFPLLARSAESNPLGKLNYQLPKMRLADETGERLQEMASQAGMSVSEYARLCIEVSVHGRGHVQKCALRRIDRVVHSVA